MTNIKNSEIYSMYMNSPMESHKWESYFNIYDELFQKYRDKDVTFVEVGIHNGGSLYMWRNYFGKNSRIIGVELNPNAKQLEKDGFQIYIGDQSDPNFWKNFYNEVKNIDILLDDGSHLYFDQLTTLKSTIPFINDSGMVVIEDTHTSYMQRFGYKTTKTFTDFINKIILNLHKRHPYSELSKKSTIYDCIYKVTNYESITAFHIDRQYDKLNKPIMNNNNGIGSTDFRYDKKFVGKILNLFQKLENNFYPKKKNFLIKILLRINFLIKTLIYKIYNLTNLNKINKFFREI